MPESKVFGKQTEAFADVVDALMINPRTRAAFTDDPLGTLGRHGIEFVDPDVAKLVDKEIRAVASGITLPGDSMAWTNPAVKVATKSTAPIVSVVVNVASQAARPEEVMRIDEDRVDRIRDIAYFQQRVVELELEVARLRGFPR